MAKQLSLSRFKKKTRIEDEACLDQAVPNEELQQDGHETFVGSGNEEEVATSSSSSSSHQSHASLLAKVDMQAPVHRLPPASKEPIGTPASALSAIEESATQPKLVTFPATVALIHSLRCTQSLYL